MNDKAVVADFVTELRHPLIHIISYIVKIVSFVWFRHPMDPETWKEELQTSTTTKHTQHGSSDG